MTDVLLGKYMESLRFQINKLPAGRIFKVREIIGAEEWEKLTVQDKRLIGLRFQREVRRGGIPHVAPVDGKAEQRVQSYKKI